VKKILFITLAVILALGVGLVGCAPAEEEEEEPEPSDTVVIGVSWSETGPLKDVHDFAFGPLLSTYLDEHPTIKVGNTDFPVELDARDDASSVANMIDNTEAIIANIETGEAHFLFGPTCTAFLEAQAPICAEAHVVQMTAEGGATSLIAQMGEYEYTFVNLSFSDWFELPVFAKLIAEAHEEAFPGTTPHAYIGYQNDDHGLEYSGVAQTYFPQEGIVIDGLYPMDSGDTAANGELIAAAAAANDGAGSDILCVFAYPEHVFGTCAVAQALGYDPKALIVGPGGCFGVYGMVIAADLAEGVMTFAVANDKTSPAMEELFNDILVPAVGAPSVDFWGHPCYWAALEMWEESVKNVGEVLASGFVIDQDDYRDYLRTTKFTTVFGETWYVDGPDLNWPVPDATGGLLNYQCHTGEIGQWQSGWVEIVGYEGIGTASDPYELANYVVTEDFIYPKPAWPTP
jgi:hypothetical protein